LRKKATTTPATPGWQVCGRERGDLASGHQQRFATNGKSWVVVTIIITAHTGAVWTEEPSTQQKHV